MSKQRKVEKVETRQRPHERVKAKAKVKVGRRVTLSQRLTPKVTKLPHHVCFGRKVHATVEHLPGADTWVSVVCTDHSPLQHLNKSIHGPAYREKLKKKQKNSIKLLRSAEVFMDKVLSLGGRVAFELPAENELWNDEQFRKFEESHGMCRVYFDGCAFNLRGRQGGLIKKPWAVSTTDFRLIQYLDQHTCDGSHEHEHAMGGNASRTAYYTREMAETIIESLYPKKFYHNVPSMISSAFVTKNLKKSEWINNPEAVETKPGMIQA